jgi:hypothetical protein
MVIFGFKSDGWECPPAHVKTTIANGYSSCDALIGIDARSLLHVPAELAEEYAPGLDQSQRDTAKVVWIALIALSGIGDVLHHRYLCCGIRIPAHLVQ